MKRLTLIGLLISTVFCTTFCGKKCKDSNTVVSTLDPELVAYFGVFKQGSYWVYENADQSKKDSAYIIRSSRYYEEIRNLCHKDETITFTIKSSNQNLIPSDSCCVRGIRDEINAQDCMSSSFFMPENKLIHFTPNITNSVGIVERISSITLNSTPYTGNVLVFYGRSSDTLYMQENLGVIGWKSSGETFNLIKYDLQ